MALAKLSELLSSVKDNSYAIGSFNVSNMEMAMGAIKAAEKMQAPIIIQIAEGRLRYSPLEILGPIMMAAAKKYNCANRRTFRSWWNYGNNKISS